MPDPVVRRESGRRVVVRFHGDDGGARDVTGDLQSGRLGGADPIVVLPDFGPVVRIPAERVVAAKPIPARVVRPASSLSAIARVIWLGRSGVERYRLGGWILAVPVDGGVAAEDGCCLPIGDPGLPLPEAVDAVERFHRGRSLPTRFEVVSALPGSGREDPCPGLAELLTARGYRSVGRSVTLVAELRSVAQYVEHAPVPPDVRRADVVDGWLALAPCSGTQQVSAEILRSELARGVRLGAKVAQLRLAADDAEGLALARDAGLLPHAGTTGWLSPSEHSPGDAGTQ